MSNLCYVMNQTNYNKIPGSPFAYWVSGKFIDSFKNKNIEYYTLCAAGVSSGDNDKYLRLWYEVDFTLMTYSYGTDEAFQSSYYQYVPCNKGGTYSKWYGNNEYIARWKHYQEFHRNGSTYKELLFREGLTWSAITAYKFSARYYPSGYIFDHASPSLFTKDSEFCKYFLGLINSIYSEFTLNIINPTINMGADSVRKLPVLVDEKKKIKIDSLVDENISISKTDWDSFETSWDFKKHPLI